MSRIASPARRLWLGLAIFGTLLPNAFFLQHYAGHGFDPPAAWQLATASGIGRGVSADLVCAIGLFWIWAGGRLRRQGRLGELWLYVVLAVGLGLSCALPVFLFRQAGLGEKDSG